MIYRLHRCSLRKQVLGKFWLAKHLRRTERKKHWTNGTELKQLFHQKTHESEYLA